MQKTCRKGLKSLHMQCCYDTKACWASCIVLKLVKVSSLKSIAQETPQRPLHWKVIALLLSCCPHCSKHYSSLFLLKLTSCPPFHPHFFFQSLLFQTLLAMTMMSFSNSHLSLSLSVSASMLCLAGCTVGKLNRHVHSASASLLVHCPRWQCWAPSLVWLSIVWFPL